MRFYFNKLKVFLSIFLVILISNSIVGFQSNSDPVSLILPDLGETETGSVSVPFIVDNFNEIYSFTVSINYDSEVLTFNNISESKVPNLLSGGSTGQVRLGFFGTSAVNLGQDTLLYLNFTYNGNFSKFEFGSNNEVTDLLGNRYELLETDGSIGIELYQTNEWVNFFSFNSTIDGNPIQVGDVVTAYDSNGNLAGKFSVIVEGNYGPMKVYKDDPATTNIDEGLDQGEEVVFKINGFNASPNGPGSATWSSHDDSIELNLSVITNQPPVIETIPNQEINEGESFIDINLDNYVSDGNNAGNELVWTYSGNTNLVVQIDANRVLKVSTPDANWNGSETITLVVKDPGNLSDSKTVTFTVLPVNDNPTITSTAVTSGIEDQLYSYQVTATDPENDPLTFTLKKNPDFLTISPTGLVSGTPTNADVGIHEIELEVTDGNGGSATQNYNLTIQNVNDNPTITSTAVTSGIEDQLYSYQVTAADPENDPLTFALNKNPDFLTISPTGLVSGTPTNADVGLHEVEVEVTDGNGGSATQNYNLTIQNVNDSPTITSTAVTSGIEDQLYSYQVTATDPENDPLTFALNKNPDFLTISPTGLVSGTPTNADVGIHEVELEVTDGNGGSATQNYNLTIQNVNDNPTITSTAVTSGIEDQLYSYQVAATDPENDPLTFVLNKNPDFLTISPTGLVSGTPTNADVGSHEIELEVTDGNGGSATQNYNLTIQQKPFLDTPILLLPTNNNLNTTLTDLILDWEDVAQALTYELQISVLSDFGDIFYSQINLSESAFQIPNGVMQENTKYYWKVRASDVNRLSEWSIVYNYTTEILPLNSPTPLTPANNDSNISLTPDFDWTDIEGAISYSFQISFLSDFSDIFNVDDIATSNYLLTTGNLVENTEYFWRVKAYSSEKESDWSEVFSFKTGIIPLDAPTLLTPADNDESVSLLAAFDWSNVVNASNYQLELSLLNDFSTIILRQENIVSSNYQLTVSLQENTEYFWRVRALNTAKISEWSQIFSFKTEIIPLIIPTLLSPANGSEDLDPNSVELDWNDVTDATSYDIQVSGTNNFGTFETYNSTTSNFTLGIGQIDYESQFFWRVKTKNATKESEYSAAWSFSTMLAPLDAPGLIAPADGATNVSLTLTLDWSNVTAATGYGLQIATDETFTSMAISADNLDESTYSIPNGILSSETMYYWRVNAIDATRTSDWSEVRDFTTEPITGIDIYASGIPDDFALLQNYPNPFNPSTNIRFALPEAAEVKVVVVDLLGREVVTLFNGFRSAGFFELNWNASNISSGTYIYRIDAKSETGKEFSKMKKMMFVK